MKKYYPLILIVGIIFIPMMFFHSCANTTEAPTGGKKDTIPPYIVAISPLPGSTNVPLSGTRFSFTFNEYVTLKTPANIIISPPQQKPLKTTLRGKTLTITTEEPLDPDKTYTITFTDAIADANEGNMFAGYTYAFSTGDRCDSMMITGTVLNCNTLAYVKGATVLLYKDHSDSAVFKHRPDAAVRTDDWGYFCLPFIKDTSYRLYAIKEETPNYIYDPDNDLIAFADSLIVPVMTASDTTREMLRYDMKDTVACLARTSQYQLKLFREKPSKQFLRNKERTAERAAYITFMAPNVWIDSLWVRGYRAEQIITQFNPEMDSLEIWLNNIRREAPDTMNIFVNYRKTDSTGRLAPVQEKVKLALDNNKRTYSKRPRRNLKHDDTTCVFKISAQPETVEQNGIELVFNNPVINADFDSIQFYYINTRQKRIDGTFKVEQDTLNLRRYTIRPDEKLQQGFDYVVKVPHNCFRDINGFWSDSTEVKVTLPKDETLSQIEAVITGVESKVIIDLLTEKRDKVLRSYVVDKDCTLYFPYLKTGRYSMRITRDENNNSMVDTGNVLEHRQPEDVKFLLIGGNEYFNIPASSEIVQNIDLKELFER